MWFVWIKVGQTYALDLGWNCGKGGGTYEHAMCVGGQGGKRGGRGGGKRIEWIFIKTGKGWRDTW